MRLRTFGWPFVGALASTALAVGFGAPAVRAVAEPSTASTLTASFAETSSWAGGYVGVYTISNHGSQASQGWHLAFELPAGATMVNSWGGTVSATGDQVNVANASWNGVLAVGQSTTFGFELALGGTSSPPTACTIDGAPCGGPTPPATSVPPTSTTVGPTTTTGRPTTTVATTTTTVRPTTTTIATTTTRPTTTSLATTTTAAGPTTTSSAGTPGLSAVYQAGSAWDGGYNGNFLITNTGQLAVTSWELRFELAPGQQLVNSWNGVVTISGSWAQATNASWNGVLAPGASATLGFQVSGPGSATSPVACSLTGGVCSTGTASAPSSTTTTAAPTTTSTTSPASTTSTTSPTTVPVTPNGTTVFAPYVDMTLRQQDLAALSSASGTHGFTLAFVVSQGACTPSWGGVIPVGSSTDYVGGAISALEKAGGTPIISFGGEAGTELALSCSSASQLEAAYQKVVDTYHVYDLDFDIEGAAVGDTASVAMRSQALAQLQRTEAAAGHKVRISLTLPVLPTGLPAAEMSVVRSAVAAGVNLSVVNAMTMDYGGAVSDPTQMGYYADQAAAAVEAQLATLYPAASAAQLWAMVGITPLIGQNDVAGEVFTLSDASQVASFAAAHGVGRVAMWSVTRDQQCSQGVITYDSPTCSGVLQSQWEFSHILEGA